MVLAPRPEQNDCRLFLLLLRDLLDGREASRESLRQLRRWLHWQGQDRWRTLVKAIEALPAENHYDLQRALSTGQIESKLWLIEMLKGIVEPKRRYGFLIIGGWVGVLPLLLDILMPESVNTIRQIDIDPMANRLAAHLNKDLISAGRMRVFDRNALEFDYGFEHEIIVNTSCEHFTPEEMHAWMARVPKDRYLVLQTNDFQGEPGHVNCVPDVFTFRKSLPLKSTLFTGELAFEAYRRFMVIAVSEQGELAHVRAR
ncbi:MAG TPA: hypothetical protein PKC28_05830 [Bdellovibrionales bacterium]|nr:hypothetical protein [Bdellovibrionales bacterium]